jgi:drug/metabolite transporter (DMT)-like permease
MSASRRIDNQWIGIGLYVIALIAVVLISMLVKVTSDRVPVQQALLFRFSICLLPILLIGKLSREKLVLRTNRIGDYLIRSIAGVSSIGLFFVAVSLIPLATATAISYAAPIFCVVFSIPLLGELIGVRRWTAVIVGFIGVLIISWPGSDIVHVGSIAGVGSAIGGALVIIYLRKMSDTESPLTTSLFYNAFGAIVFLVWCYWIGWTPLTGNDIYWMIAIGLLAGVQQFCFASAFRFAEATYLAPFEYLALVLAAAAGFLFWGEVPSTSTWIGGFFITAAGMFMLQRKSKVLRTQV